LNPNHDQSISFDEAAELLAAFSCIEIKPIESDSEKVRLIQALNLFIDLSDYQNFGICADNSAQGFAALLNYWRGLDYEPYFDLKHHLGDVPKIDEPIYIKYITKNSGYHIDRYGDKYRGVLISFHSDENDHVNGTYGYFPLDLF